MRNNAIDFDRARKKRQRLHRFKQLMILAGVAAFVAVAVFLSDLLVEKDVSARLSDLSASFGGGGYPIPLPGGIIRDTGELEGNLAVLNDTNLYLYNKKGRMIGNIQQMTGRTVLEAEKNRALLYDVGGRRLEIYSPTKKLHTQNLPDMLLVAGLGRGGGYYAVTVPKQYVAQVDVYSPEFDWLFTWYSAEYMISGASLSPKGNMLAVSCVDASGGVLESVIYLFRFSTKEQLAEIRIPDELAVDLDFAGENLVSVLTEKGLSTFDIAGKETGRYDLPSLPLTAFERNGQETLVLCGAREEGTQRILLLSDQARELASLSTGERVLDLALNRGAAYLLTDRSLTWYNLQFEPLQIYDQAEAQRVALVADRLYSLTQTEIHVLGG